MHNLDFDNMNMKTSVTQWGNSIAVRIPKPFAEQLDIKNGTNVEITIRNDVLVVAKSSESLDELMDGATLENLHSEILTGDIKGNEIW